MKILSNPNNTIRMRFLGALLSLTFLTACNKELPPPKPIETPAPSGETIMEKLNAADYSILKAAIEKAGTFASTTGKLSDILANPEGVITFFAPDNTAILRSFALMGLPADASSLNFFRAGQLDSLLKYHLIGGLSLTTNSISPVAPALNLYLQSALLLAPPSPSLPPGYRMPIFLGKQGSSGFVNNIPIVQADIAAANGVMHKTYAALLPPDKVIWQTIAANAGGSYDYFKAAVIRADGGESASGQFQSALSTPNANFTVFVPTDAAFEQTLTQLIAKALMEGGMPQGDAVSAATLLVGVYGPTIISNPSSIPVYGPGLAAEITPELLAGVVAYHIVAQPGTTVVGYRNFLVNFPATAANLPTLVNASVPQHPGLTLQASFGALGITAATVKGLGNATASNVVLNAIPGVTHDIHHINGVIQRIDQVLLPIPL